MLELLKNKYVKCGIACLLYFLWVWWTKIYFLFPGLIVIADIYLFKMVNWRFLEKFEHTRFEKAIEWSRFSIVTIIILLFLRVFFFKAFYIPTTSMDETIKSGDVIFVSKIAYGPRLPSRPISFPFAHNSLPLTNLKSYSNLVCLPYKRAAGIRKIKHNDIVVFNFPEGDTVIANFRGHSFYYLKRTWGAHYINNNYRKIYHPVDRREPYVKRCVALPGDILCIKNGNITLNYDSAFSSNKIKYKYFVKVDSTELEIKKLRKTGLVTSDLENFDEKNSLYEIALTEKQADVIKQLHQTLGIMKFENTNKGFETDNIFPHNRNYPWTEDNFGPIYIPAKGQKIKLDLYNLPLYERIISVYENNTLEIRNDTIFINDIAANSYTFKMNYYFMMGDNRHYSGDSRHWGFVPEDHIEGRARFVLFSFNKNEPFLHKVKWKRLFHPIK